jgi:hypothetical protein
MDAPGGQQSIEALDLVFGALENAGVDARRRKIVWADGKRLSIEQSTDRIHAGHPGVPPDRNSRAGLARKLCARILLRTPTRGTRPAHRTLARRLWAQVTNLKRLAENSALSSNVCDPRYLQPPRRRLVCRRRTPPAQLLRSLRRSVTCYPPFLPELPLPKRRNTGYTWHWKPLYWNKNKLSLSLMQRLWSCGQRSFLRCP